MDNKEIVKEIYKALDEKKGEDIRIIDISNVSVISDYFILASASNINQLQAMEDAVGEQMARLGKHEKQIEGGRTSSWILMDYEDIVVHLFTEEDRKFYDLERIWKDGKTVDVHEL